MDGFQAPLAHFPRTWFDWRRRVSKGLAAEDVGLADRQTELKFNGSFMKDNS
jgi:hypothetical protein